MIKYLVKQAKELAQNWLIAALDCMQKKGDKYLPVSFDCSWSHGRNARQASGEFIFQEAIPVNKTYQKYHKFEQHIMRYFNDCVFAAGLRKNNPSETIPTQLELQKVQTEGLGLVTTYRTSINESFNQVKLIYLDKKIDFWKPFVERHALAIIHYNDGYLNILKPI
ncbi:hypothetical protein C2G38_2095921, partial [Gigaspora rosea]